SLKRWGTNYRMTKLQAVAGRVQLRRLDAMNDARRARVAALASLLQDVPGLTLPAEPPGYRHVWYGYTLLLDAAWAGPPRNQVVDRLIKQYGVGTWIMNMALGDYDSVLRTLGHSPDDTPVSTDIGRRLFCPALHPLMTDDDLRYIAAAIKASMAAVAADMGLLVAVRGHA
ncbi:MAG: DegT/DnrJ/EryC1/StrS family aminotransferase, partial [Chloroflexota bacterium]